MKVPSPQEVVFTPAPDRLIPRQGDIVHFLGPVVCLLDKPVTECEAVSASAASSLLDQARRQVAQALPGSAVNYLAASVDEVEAAAREHGITLTLVHAMEKRSGTSLPHRATITQINVSTRLRDMAPPIMKPRPYVTSGQRAAKAAQAKEEKVLEAVGS